jgi:nucleotide-binding universal stress UspA family protein
MKVYDPKKILVPVDFSDLSAGVIQAGVDIAQLRGAEVTVLHVAKENDYLSHYGGEFPGASISVSKLRDDAWMSLDSRLKDLVKQVAGGREVKADLMWGSPVRDIVHIAESGSFDLIVMATHGRRMLSRFFLGSVTEEVIRRAPCPVLAIRAKVAEELRIGAEVHGAAVN